MYQRHHRYSRSHRLRLVRLELLETMRNLRRHARNRSINDEDDENRNNVDIEIERDDGRNALREERIGSDVENERQEERIYWNEVLDPSSGNDSDSEYGVQQLVNADRLRSNMRDWAVQEKVNRSSVNTLLGVLRTENVLKCLPGDVRTLLQTPRKASIVAMECGKYCHFGIAEGVNYVLKNCSPAQLPDRISLAINIDGLPLVKSSKSQLWPILGIIRNINNKEVFIIGAYHGYTKPPSPDVYLQHFIEDAENLTNNGIRISDDAIVPFEVASFICDAPARSYICCVRGHTAYYGCGKCETRGEYAGGSVVFPDIGATLRTTESFINQTQARHHTGVSPLLRINDDLVSNVPFDYMHMILLGVTKKILKRFTGKVNPMKLGCHQVNEISTRLLSLRKHVVCEFSRKPRGLDELDRMKATEFRQFLLYTGMIVLRKVVSRDVYNNFLYLSLATRILVTPNVSLEENRLAKTLVDKFIDDFINLYGLGNATYNVHGLQHIPDDALKWGALDEFSAFPYENYLQEVKKLIRRNDRPLEQLSNRIAEKRNATTSCAENAHADGITLGKVIENGPLVGDCCAPMYANVKIKNFKISTKEPNNYCITEDETTVVRVENICTLRNCTVLVGKELRIIRPFFSEPVPSTCFGIVECEAPDGPYRVFPIHSIHRKAVVLPVFQEYVQRKDSIIVIPLLHEGNVG